MYQDFYQNAQIFILLVFILDQDMKIGLDKIGCFWAIKSRFLDHKNVLCHTDINHEIGEGKEITKRI